MNLKLFLSYFRYLIKSNNLHGIHSPFVFNFIKDIIYGKNSDEEFEEIENIRRKLNKNSSIVEGWDYGKNKKSTELIRNIISKSAKSHKYCRLLYRIVKWKNPQISIELGTSLGISSLYICKALNNKSELYTFEGNSGLVKIANGNLKKLNFENAKIVQGDFNQTLKPLIDKLTEIDFVFFDGNHHYAPTLSYFEICLSKASENAIFVFDDINWSEEMQKAWKKIKAHTDVNLTIDLFFMGIVFIQKRLIKEHFVVRF